jgi:3-deoxy-manno-octulosonate cytidylyltransferase (CMP-KDO synthetase)
VTRAICVIPARMASSRYPGKPLVPLLGMPLILHVWHRCRLCARFERVVVATCDEEIRSVVERAGGEAVMTASTHERATDRSQEAVATLRLALGVDDLVVMVQGDEALMTPAFAEAILGAYERDHPAVVNLASRLYRAQDHDDPNTVKVVAAPGGHAIYFSRAPIPSRARAKSVPMYQQTGVIGFAAGFLERFSALPQTPLEIIESVDMLRVIEHGLPIALVRTEAETIGVDTPDDRERAEILMREDPTLALYMKLFP